MKNTQSILALALVIATSEPTNAAPVEPAAPDATYLRNAAARWREPASPELAVVAGSALDFSATLAGADQRQLCATSVLGGLNSLAPSKAEMPAYLAQLRRSGYNLVRFHAVDAALMDKATKDFDFDPQKQDDFDRFAAELSKAGIGIMSDILTLDSGAYGNIPNRWRSDTQLKLRLNLDDPEARQHWKTLVDKVFARKNPYLGHSLLEDPALKVVALVNEGGIAFTSLMNRQTFPQLVRPRFNDWLAKKYGDADGLKKAWQAEAGNDEDPKRGTVELPVYMARNVNPRNEDFARFLTDQERATFGWMTAYLQSKGYKGLITAINNETAVQKVASRSALSAVDLHMYNDLPEGSFETPMTVKHESVFDNDLKFIRQLLPTRVWGKPFYVSEFGDVYWNRNRREGNVLFGAYAALQGWDGICQYGENATQLRYDAQKKFGRYSTQYPFYVWDDPIAAASDRINALLFRRGDVSPAKRAVAMVYREGPAQTGWVPYVRNADPSLARLGFISRVGWMPEAAVDGAGKPAAAAKLAGATPDLVLDPFGGNGADMAPPARAQLLMKAGAQNGAWLERVARLREGGLLDKANATDAAAGVIESDTGQVMVDLPGHRARVVTPRSELVMFRDRPLDGRFLRVDRATAEQTIGVFAVDAAPLASSKRLLLVQLTDARPTDMRFADPDQKTVTNWGHWPVTLRGGVAMLKLGIDGAGWKLYALNLDGSRREARPVGADGSVLLDNLAGDGATVYYELVRE
ncbi:beta-galactosidase [Derxia gummosa]|uniref:Beta-galactosidase n=1 Tax=Derxia gummosa DSM 723 TaxID=1121388 RepID=A0A8B6X4H6_9BURK|nr:beta-galactosidase [Derxia gummosa]